MFRKKFNFAILIVLSVFVLFAVGCFPDATTPVAPKSASGVVKKDVKVQTDASGWTAEQNNIAARLKADNQPGSIKHLYIYSAMTGDLLIYSTVKGKVTSSGKRLTPYNVTAIDGQYVNSSFNGNKISIAGKRHYTSEVLQDDGTYGHSIPYLFWWDTKEVFHKQYISGGMMVHISDQPLRVPKTELQTSVIMGQ